LNFGIPLGFAMSFTNAYKEQNLALCAAESETLTTPEVVTADYGYFRLRLVKYTDQDIAAYARQIRSAVLSGPRFGLVGLFFPRSTLGTTAGEFDRLIHSSS
jgi:hypothetical protein